MYLLYCTDTWDFESVQLIWKASTPGQGNFRFRVSLCSEEWGNVQHAMVLGLPGAPGLLVTNLILRRDNTLFASFSIYCNYMCKSEVIIIVNLPGVYRLKLVFTVKFICVDMILGLNRGVGLLYIVTISASYRLYTLNGC